MRVLNRLPLLLRHFGIRGYERLLGIDWLALTTTGRRSGRPHTVMLDVVGRDAAGAVYVQPSTPRAAWVLNARANAAVTVDVDGRTYAATASEVTGDEGADVVLRFIRTHPRYARLVVWLVGYTPTIDVPDAVLRERLREVVVFAVRPERHTAPSASPTARSRTSPAPPTVSASGSAAPAARGRAGFRSGRSRPRSSFPGSSRA